MVHAKAAVMPSSGKVMEEARPRYTSLSSVRQQEMERTRPKYTSLTSVGDDDLEDSNTASRPKTHRRHHSLFSSASAPVDLTDDPSMRRTPSSNGSSSLRKSTSWKLGDFWTKFRGPSSAIDTATPATLKTETIAESDNLGPPKEQKPPIDRKKEADENSVAVSKSLHFTSLDLSSSIKDSFERPGPLPEAPKELSGKWREIQGAKDWTGLLDPLDIDLRKETIRYGEFAQVAYDNFEGNAHSKYAGSARHSKQKVMVSLGKESCGYTVTRYLYAASDLSLPGVLVQPSFRPWDRDSNWMGYVAVATDPAEIQRLGRRDIVVVWRGAPRINEWLVDAQTQMTPIRFESRGANNPNAMVMEIPLPQRPKVERTFWNLYTCRRPASQFNRKSASEQVIAELQRLLALYKGEVLSITVTGHNVGGALAVLTAYEIAERGLHNQETRVPVTAITFGAPHVGDGAFRARFEGELGLKALRVANVHDVVAKSMANFYPLWGSSDASKHVGVELQLNHKLSPYLKVSKDPTDWHNLECYLHHVDGFQGLKAKSFELVTGRDPALVNKYADVLHEQFCIPAHWWQPQFKGLALSSEGRWEEPDRVPEESPSVANRERFV